jgi:hypothetical protein
MHPLTKMMLRALYPPIVLFVSIPCLFLLFGWFVPSQFEGSPMLAPLGHVIFHLTLLVAAVVGCLAIGESALAMWRVRQWEHGAGPSCRKCGGLVVERTMRRRHYRICLLCNDRIREN